MIKRKLIKKIGIVAVVGAMLAGLAATAMAGSDSTTERLSAVYDCWATYDAECGAAYGSGGTRVTTNSTTVYTTSYVYVTFTLEERMSGKSTTNTIYWTDYGDDTGYGESWVDISIPNTDTSRYVGYSVETEHEATVSLGDYSDPGTESLYVEY